MIVSVGSSRLWSLRFSPDAEARLCLQSLALAVPNSYTSNLPSSWPQLTLSKITAPITLAAPLYPDLFFSTAFFSSNVLLVNFMTVLSVSPQDYGGSVKAGILSVLFTSVFPVAKITLGT